MTGHVTAPPAALADRMPTWVTLLRAPNPGPMTLEGTNTWVVRASGAAEAVVIDPGPDDPSHLAAVAECGPVALILLTHGHLDHTEGVDDLRAMTGAVVRGPVGAAHPGGRPLAGGDLLDVAGVRIRVLATPGHTADSACFLVEGEGEQVIFTGDTILGRGTTVVAHPDGNLGDYLASLAALSAYSGVLALPGHGPALADCAVAADFYLAHRRARLDQVRQAVVAGATTADEVVARVYAELDPALRMAALWSVRAQLDYLSNEDEEPDRPAGSSSPGGSSGNRESESGVGRLESP